MLLFMDFLYYSVLISTLFNNDHDHAKSATVCNSIFNRLDLLKWLNEIFLGLERSYYRFSYFRIKIDSISQRLSI